MTENRDTLFNGLAAKERKCFTPIVVAVIQYLIMIFTHYEKNVFVGEKPWATITGKCMYFLFLIVLVIIWKFIFYVLEEIFFEKSSFTRQAVIYSGVYFAINFVVLLLIWPGAWSADDYGVLRNAVNMELLPWQHFISSIVQIMSLFLIPTMAGVLIVQIIIISAIIGYFIAKTYEILPVRGWKKLVLFIPFFLPPILLNNFSAFRAILHSYLVLLLSLILCLTFKEESKVSWNRLLFMIFLAITVGSWRTEYMYYCLTIPVILFLVYREKKISKTMLSVAVGVIIFGIICSTKCNNILLHNNNYSLVSTFAQMGDLIKVADPEKDAEEIGAIDKVIKLDILREHPDDHGVYVHWQYNLIRGGIRMKSIKHI